MVFHCAGRYNDVFDGLSVSNNLVLAFLVYNSLVLAIEGVLASLTFDPTVDGGIVSLSGLTVSSSDGNACFSVTDGMVDGCCDEFIGACYGDATDICGVCGGSDSSCSRSCINIGCI